MPKILQQPNLMNSSKAKINWNMNDLSLIVFQSWCSFKCSKNMDMNE